MPNISLRNLTNALLSDHRASANDGKFLTRLVDEKLITREDLHGELDVIRSTVSPSRNTAGQVIERYLEKTAHGLEAHFPGVPPDLAKRLEEEGVTSPVALLSAAATPTQRLSLADATHRSEGEILSLAKQADLMRAKASPMLAKALVEVGVSSIPDLAAQTPAKLRLKLEAQQTSIPFLGAFKLSTKAELSGLIAAAQGLPEILELGFTSSSFAKLPVGERARMLLEGLGVTGEDQYLGSAHAFLQTVGASDQFARYDQLKEQAVSQQFEFLGYPATVEADNEYTYQTSPKVSLLRNEAGGLLGAQFNWYADDGIEGMSITVIYDHVEKRLTAYAWSESANGETGFELLAPSPTTGAP